MAANQNIAFSGVHAHHQNRISERMIKTVTYRARSMLLNVIICWIDVITTDLWSYEIKLANDVGHKCPDKSGLTALEHFSSTKGYTIMKMFILLDRLASSSIPNFVKRNIFKNGNID